MAQQNIDFGSFPDDPDADAIRTAFSKVQNNFNQIFSANANSAVTSINRTPGAGITVSDPTGNVIISANLAFLQVATSTLSIGQGVNGNSTANITSSAQSLVIDLPSTLNTSNLVLTGNSNVGGYSNVVGNLSSGNANLGNLAKANFFEGDGGLLSNIVSTSATTAETVTTNAQPNITSVGTLTSLSVSGDIAGENFTSNTGIFSGNGSSLHHIVGANVTGTVANATYATSAGSTTTAGTVTTAAQPNITSVGTLTSLGVNGTVTAVAFTANTGVFTGNGSGLSQIAGANVTGTVANATYATSAGSATTAGTVTTNAQPNITSVGVVTVLNSSGTVTAPAFTANTGIFTGNGAGLSQLVGANVTGTVANATYATSAGSATTATTATSATTSGTVTTAAQPNITSTGTLNTLNVNGTVTAVSITANTGVFTGNGNGLSSLQGSNISGEVAYANTANSVAGANVSGAVSYATTANSVAGANVSGAVSYATTANSVAGANVSGAVGLATYATTANSVAGANVTGTVANATYATSAGTAGTVTTASQPNITSLGTLTGLTVNGITNLGSNGNVIISGGTNGYFLQTDGAGNLTWSNTTASGNLTVGGANTQIQFNDGGTLGANASLTFDKANTTFTANNIVATSTANLGAVGNVTITGGTTGQVLTTNGSGVLSWSTTSAGSASGSDTQVQFNDGGAFAGNTGFTFNKTTGTLAASYFNGAGNALSNIQGANVSGAVSYATTANSVAGANVSGTVANATYAVSAGTAGTVTTNAQPNITSVGTLSSLSVTANANVGNIGATNVVANSLVAANSTMNIATSTATTINIGSATTTQINIASPGTTSNSVSYTMNLFQFGGVYDAGSNRTLNFGTDGGYNTGHVKLNIGGQYSNTYSNIFGIITVANTSSLTGTVNTVLLTASGNITSPQLISNVATGTAPFVVTSTTQVANLSVATAGSATTAGTVTTAAQPNITSVGTLSSLTVTANASAGNLTTAGQLVSSVATGSAPLVVTSTTRVSNLNVDYANVADFINVTAPGTGTGYVVFANATTGNITEYTSAGITSNLANNSITATTFVGALSGAATTAGTVTTNAQPNITSVGALTSLSVVGNATAGNLISNGSANISNGMTITSGGASITGNVGITGNLSVTGNINYTNVTDLVVGDPLIYVGANNTGNLYDLGLVASFNDGTYEHTGFARDHTDGVWKLFTNVVAEPTTTIDFANGVYAPFKSGAITSTGTLSATQLISNIANGTAPFVVTSTTQVANLNVANAGLAAYATVANSVAGANVTGAVSYATTANSVAGANVSGAVTYATTANAVAGANVSGAVSYATIANGVAGGNVVGQVGNALVAGTVYTNAQPNITSTGTLTSLIVGNATANTTFGNGIFTATGNANVANIGGTGAFFTTLAGNLTTAAQPNITSVGTLSSLAVTANANVGNLNSGGKVVASTLESNVATGTAPLVVASTTLVNNLNADLLDGYSTATAATANTVSVRDTNASLTANVFIGSGASLTNIPAANITGTLPSISSSGNLQAANLIATAYHIRSVGTSITAAGTTQGAGTALTKEINIVSTVAAGANAVVLPTAVAGMVVNITNTTANAMLVFPASGAQINSLGTNLSFSQGTTTIQFIAPTSTQWYTVGATYA